MLLLFFVKNTTGEHLVQTPPTRTTDEDYLDLYAVGTGIPTMKIALVVTITVNNGFRTSQPHVVDCTMWQAFWLRLAAHGPRPMASENSFTWFMRLAAFLARKRREAPQLAEQLLSRDHSQYDWDVWWVEEAKRVKKPNAQNRRRRPF